MAIGVGLFAGEAEVGGGGCSTDVVAVGIVVMDCVYAEGGVDEAADAAEAVLGDVLPVGAVGLCVDASDTMDVVVSVGFGGCSEDFGQAGLGVQQVLGHGWGGCADGLADAVVQAVIGVSSQVGGCAVVHFGQTVGSVPGVAIRAVGYEVAVGIVGECVGAVVGELVGGVVSTGGTVHVRQVAG